MTNEEYLAKICDISSFASNEELYKAQAEYLLNKLNILQKFNCKIHSNSLAVDVEIGSFSHYLAPHQTCLLEKLDLIQNEIRGII